MARVRNNQGHRSKILNVFMRPFLEQENTQEREAYLQARETVKPLQDQTWKLAKEIVRKHYTPEDIKMAYHLQNKFDNVESHLVNLDRVFEFFKESLSKFDNEHGFANSRARLRMATLYQAATANNGIVVGTGNKIEDFGIGFHTKYGDGGVDISPIADCKKTQVWKMGERLGVLREIIQADPTDGLWEDGRPDVQQIGISYQDLEKAMEDLQDKNHKKYLKSNFKYFFFN